MGLAFPFVELSRNGLRFKTRALETFNEAEARASQGSQTLLEGDASVSEAVNSDAKSITRELSRTSLRLQMLSAVVKWSAASLKRFEFL